MHSFRHVRTVVKLPRVDSRQFVGILFCAMVFLPVCGSADAQTPALVHSNNLSALINATGPGNNFRIQYGGSMGMGTLGGNLLVLSMTYPHGSTVSSIVDNRSSTYTLGPIADSGTGGWVTAMYYAPGAVAGITQITVNFSSTVNDWHGSVREYSGVATSSPLDGTCTNNSATPSTSEMRFCNYSYSEWRPDSSQRNRCRGPWLKSVWKYKRFDCARRKLCARLR